MPPSEVYRYRTEVNGKSLGELEALLTSNTMRGRKEIVLDLIADRPEPEAARALEKYIDSLNTARRPTPASDPSTDMLLARALVRQARQATPGRDADYVKRLEPLLDNKNAFVAEAAAIELGVVGTPEAREALKGHETTGGGYVKENRLRIDFWNLPDDEFVAALLQSARAVTEELGEAIPRRLAAERSLLGQRSQKTFLSPILQKESERLAREPEESVPGKAYAKFVAEVLQHSKWLEQQPYHASRMVVPVSSMPQGSAPAGATTGTLKPGGRP